MKKRIVCHFPWSSVYILPNGDVKHCCESNLTNLGNLNEQSIQDIWNGNLYRMVRNKIAKGDFSGAFCNPYCRGLRTGDGYPWPEKTSGARELEDNEDLAIVNFENCSETVAHFPTQLHIEFSNNCNLRCIMCLYEFKPPYQSVADHIVEQILDISRYASLVVLIGGEVFMNKSDLDFMDRYQPQDGSWMGFGTNGTYLNEGMIERIKKFRRMGMQISIDGTVKEIYEKIRVRGKWEEVDANIRRIVNTARELRANGYEWEIGLAYVVMKSNFANIAHSVEYAVSLGVPIDFNPLVGYNFFKENIFVYKDALESVGNWRYHLDSAINTLEKYRDSYPYYNRVLVRLRDIETLLQKPKIRVYPFIIRTLNFLVPDDSNGKAQGLTKHDGYVGRIIEIYDDWRTGNSSLISTLSYIMLKAFDKVKKRFSPKKRSSK